MSMKRALTIAGSDTSGGAGLQADLKTFQEFDVYGMTVITTIVTMTPDAWSHESFPIELSTIETQLKTVFEGIGVDALKTGMLGSVDVIELVGRTLDKHNQNNVVIDPVMICKGTDQVLHPETTEALKELLVPRALVVTPNLLEAGQLAGCPLPSNVEEMKECAAIIHGRGAKHVVVKGGRLPEGEAVDVYFDGTYFELLTSPRTLHGYTHGAGCTFAAAITANLAKGQAPQEAIKTAKAFVTAAIANGFPLNRFVGPTRHSAYRRG